MHGSSTSTQKPVTRAIIIVAVCLCIWPAKQTWGQGSEVVRVMQRVDTAHPHVRQVLHQWADSLMSWRRDGIGNDRSGGFFVNTGSIVQDWFAQDDEVVKQFPATVMSVEFREGGWEVRTIFARLDTASRTVVPLGILNARFHGIVDSNGSSNWVLQDAMLHATSSWDTTRVENVMYVHHRNERVDLNRAKEAPLFCKAVAERFGQPIPKNITVCLADGRDELCLVLGVEYYAFPPQSISFPQALLIVESTPETFHPHELVHVVFREYDRAHPILREGLATLLGGNGVMDFQGALSEYLEARSKRYIPSFVELFTGVQSDQSDEYVLGAVICDLVLRLHGRAALLELLRTERSSDAMLALSRLLSFDIADRQESLRSFAEAAQKRDAPER